MGTGDGTLLRRFYLLYLLLTSREIPRGILKRFLIQLQILGKNEVKITFSCSFLSVPGDTWITVFQVSNIRVFFFVF
jgi:hypothetical protein